MDKTQLLSGRIADLSKQCWNGDYLTHTNFLSASELAEFFQMPGHQHGPGTSTFNGVPYVACGGHPDSDRNCIFFLPSYLTPDQVTEDEVSGNGFIRLVRARPVNAGFADQLTHRDYLGALMHLGIDRSMTGDILINQHVPEGSGRRGKEDPKGTAYIFCSENVAELISRELTRVKHTTISCESLPPSACSLEPDLKEVSGTVASVRLDAIINMVWHLSRGKAQSLIEGENVTVNGRLVASSSFEPKEGDRVSVRGLGKFIYLGDDGSTRKGRIRAKVDLFI